MTTHKLVVCALTAAWLWSSSVPMRARLRGGSLSVAVGVRGGPHVWFSYNFGSSCGCISDQTNQAASLDQPSEHGLQQRTLMSCKAYSMSCPTVTLGSHCVTPAVLTGSGDVRVPPRPRAAQSSRSSTRAASAAGAAARTCTGNMPYSTRSQNLNRSCLMPKQYCRWHQALIRVGSRSGRHTMTSLCAIAPWLTSLQCRAQAAWQPATA